MSGLLYTDDLVLCGESEEESRAMVGRFAEVRKSKGLECHVYIAGIRLWHVSEFKYLGCVLDEAECSRKVARGRRMQVPLGP